MNGLNQPQNFDQANRADVLNCLWMDAGVVDYKLCDRGYACDQCPLDEALHSCSPHNVVSPDRRDGRVVGPFSLQGCVIAPGLFYHPGHTWARVEAEGIVRVGLDDFGQRMLGSAYSLSLPQRHQELQRGKASWSVTHQSGVAGLASPVAGKVLNVNSNLLLRPGLINRDPFGDGWTMTIEPVDLKSCLQRLMYGERVGQWLANEIDRLRSVINQILSDDHNGIIPTMTDGGLLTRQFLNGLSVEQTRRVIGSFFPLASSEADHHTAILVSQRR